MKESATQRALTALDAVKYSSSRGMDAGMVGCYVWPDRDPRMGRGVATGGGGDYAAQMLLGRLRKRGLVRTLVTEGSSVWAITAAGITELRRLEGK